MADEKKKKKGSGAGKIFMIGVIVGILMGICLGWMTHRQAPSAFKNMLGKAEEKVNEQRKKAADVIAPNEDGEK